MKKNDKVEDGFHIIQPQIKFPLRAAYGIYLINLCKEADKQGEKEGKFIEIEPMTLEEFKRERKKMNRKKLFKHEKN